MARKRTKPRPNEKCAGLAGLGSVSVEGHTEKPVIISHNWRFGDTSKGEPTVVPLEYPLCQACQACYDVVLENQVDAVAEAAGS